MQDKAGGIGKGRPGQLWQGVLYLPGEHGSLWRVVSHGGEMIGFAV